MTALQVEPPAIDAELFRGTVRELLTDVLPMARVREISERDGDDRAVWAQFTSVGLPGVLVPERLGGVGLTVDLAGVALQESGAALAPSPFLASSVLATQALLWCGAVDRVDDLLRGLAAGDVIATVAVGEGDQFWGSANPSTSASFRDGAVVVTGVKDLVLDAHVADVLLVTAVVGGVLGLFEVDAAAAGVTIEPIHMFDATRRMSRVEFAAAPARPLRTDAVPELVERLRDLGLAAIASEQAGGARRCLDDAVSYAKIREQFGRPIASFQAIKHACADMLLRAEAARSVAEDACAAIAVGRDDVPAVARSAAIYCGRAYVRNAAANMQIHGGVAFARETPAHLHVRRAKTSQLTFGRPEDHARALGDLVGIVAPPATVDDLPRTARSPRAGGTS